VLTGIRTTNTSNPIGSLVSKCQKFVCESRSYRSALIRRILSAVLFVLMATSSLQAFLSPPYSKPFQLVPLPPGIPDSIAQIVLVTATSWSSPTGSLGRLERRPGHWVQIGSSIPVNLGRKGLAWGRGLHQIIDGRPQKVEGDQRAPAGIFGLGDVFGYSRIPPVPVNLPYRPISDRDYFVDDVESNDYNTWVNIGNADPNEPTKLWKSFEVMRRPDNLYQLGIVIQQNVNPVVKGRGSAVFFHVWRGPGLPTAGCTSMSLKDLRVLVSWLEPTSSPVLIQGPSSQIENLRFAPRR
jgi:L,D-peptidoglycan transpeptidase YkuD (ErfK/YbiS/YcfS/YnhG family)